MNAPEILEKVRKTPAFLAFSAIVGHRCLNGRAASAYRILVRAGAPPRAAYELVDGWLEKDVGTEIGLLPGEMAACRLASQINNMEKHDWRVVIQRTLGPEG